MEPISAFWHRSVIAATVGVTLLAASAAGAADMCTQVIDSQPPAQDLSGVDPMRQRILETAATMIGKVKDAKGPDGFKTGWQTLLDFYRIAYDKGEKWPPQSLVDQIKGVGRPYPGGAGNPKNVQPFSWCGIFAMWAVRTAGLTHAKWVIGPQGLGPYLAHAKALARMAPGDIVVFKGPLVHHALIERIDGKDIYTIDGNLLCQQVARRKRKVADVAYYYPTVAPGTPAPAAAAPTPADGPAKETAAPDQAAEAKPVTAAKPAAPAKPARAAAKASPAASARLRALVGALRDVEGFLSALGQQRWILRRDAKPCRAMPQANGASARAKLVCHVAAMTGAQKRSPGPRLQRILKRSRAVLRAAP